MKLIYQKRQKIGNGTSSIDYSPDVITSQQSPVGSAAGLRLRSRAGRTAGRDDVRNKTFVTPPSRFLRS
jgi:hypothetical protein